MTVAPIFSSARLRSWPKHPEGGAASYLPFGEALTKRYTSDAHTAAYAVPSVARRLCLAAARELSDGVPMVRALFDIDAANSHASSGGDGSPASDEWWAEQKQKIATLAVIHPGIFAYRTRGGARIASTIEPFTIATATDATAWTARYHEWCGYLANRFGIDADPACSEWVRLFRLPHATRDGNAGPEELETIGNPFAIGTWDPLITDADRDHVPMVRRQKAARATVARSSEPLSNYVGSGLFYYVLSARGWVGAQIEPGKLAVKCPNGARHTKGSDYDTSTILWLPGLGEEVGSIWCSHAHCQVLSLTDWLSLFGRDELERARRTAGIERAA